MARGVMVLVGTKKGVFLYRSGLSRERWRLDGSHFPGETVYHVAFDPRDGASLYSGINMSWGGPRVEVSRDLGKTWKTGKNPAFPADSELTFQRTWHIEPGHPSQPNVMWAGVEPAALFRSDDRGETWVSVKALNEHPERKQWTPGGGGLGLHSIAIDPADPKWLMIGISAAGVYESRDGGKSWATANRQTKAPLPVPKGSDLGRCVHHLVAHPVVPGARFQQNHVGAYFRDAGEDAWTEVTKGLPSDFGFAAAIHPRDPKTAYLFPLEDRMRMSPANGGGVYRTRDRGKTWTRLANGLPRGARYEVMREGMATDRLDPAGVYFGTTNGELWGSADEGRSWALIAQHLPAILSVETATL